MTSTIAVLDVGKTNVKLLVFHDEVAVWRRSAPNIVKPAPPYPHEDTEAIWRFCMASLREAAQNHMIDAIVVTTHGASVVLADDRDLAAPVMDYEFAGPDELEAEYASVRPDFAETLTPAMPDGLNWARQVFFVERRCPDLFARTKHILMYPQYWAWRLTGVARNEITSLGCHGDAWNPKTGMPSSLVERLGWTRFLPPLTSAWNVLGPLRAEIATETGLGTGTPVLAGMHDSNASLIPYLLSLDTPFTVVSTGTWVVIVGVGAPVDRVVEGSGTMANVDVLGRPGPVARFMGGREFAILTEGFVQEGDESDLAAVLESGVMAVPSFAPHASPVRTQGRIRGELPDKPGARAALASLYEALFTDLQLSLLGTDRGPIVVEGPFTANSLFCGILAALRAPQSVLVDTETTGAAYGTSLLAQWPEKPTHNTLRAAVPCAHAAAVIQHKTLWRARVDEYPASSHEKR
jgi:sugar (pentulose or hexulose) kinase